MEERSRGRDTNAVNKTIRGLLKLLYPGDTWSIPEEDIEWAVKIALETRRRVKDSPSMCPIRLLDGQ